MLLPAAPQDWLAPGHLAHFINDMVEALNLKAFGDPFVPVVKLAREMGLVKLGTVAIDGTKVKAQENFTDPDSRIMKRAGGGFDPSYKAQTAVDEAAHIIVAPS
jgi:hypothetical protein